MMIITFENEIYTNLESFKNLLCTRNCDVRQRKDMLYEIPYFKYLMIIMNA